MFSGYVINKANLNREKNLCDVAHDVDASFGNAKMTLKSVRYLTTLLYEIAVSGCAYDIFQQHFFRNILQGISIIYSNNKLHNYSKCKNFRQVLLQRARETDGLFLYFSGSGSPIHFLK